VENNLLPKNCHITKSDIFALADDILLLPWRRITQRKTVQESAEHVEIKFTDIPDTIFSRYRDIVIGGDVTFVNKIPFVTTISRKINFGTAEMLQTNQQNNTILTAIKQVKNV
jgi:hypothetical protein